MKNLNIVKISVAGLLTCMLTLPILAQENRQVMPERAQVTREVNGRSVTVEVPTMLEATKANFEKYKSDLLAIVVAQKEVAKMLHLENKINEMLDPMLQQMPTLKFNQEVPPNFPGFPDLSDLKNAVLVQQRVIAQAIANGAGRTAQYVPTDPFPGAEYSLNLCPLNPQPGEVAYASGWVVLAAELVRDLAHDACNQTILAFVFGGNTRLACIIVDIVYSAARIANYPIQFCDADTLQGQLKGSNKRTEFIKDQLAFSINNDNTNKALLSTQLTNTESHIVVNDNNNKAALGSRLGLLQTLIVKAAIVRNLATDPATNAAVGIFQLPASKGGYLEVVRQTLIDAYNAQVAAAGPGVTIYNPSSELSLGANFTSQGKYREAYYYYRRGYRSVVKYP